MARRVLKTWDALCDLVPFELFKNHERHSWWSVTFSNVAGFSLHFTKSDTPPWVFFTPFKLYKWTKSRKVSYVMKLFSKNN